MALRRLGILAGCIVLLGGALSAGHAADEHPATSKFIATYDMSLAGFDLGKFRLTARFKGHRYRMDAKGKFEILAGLIYRGEGTTRSAGRLTETDLEPSIFEVSYEGGDKKEERRIAFADGAVSDFSIEPEKRPNPKRLPLTEDQLEGVLDPLTGAFLSVRSDDPPDDPDVCRKTIAVFDGQQRFDIVLKPKRTDETLDDAPRDLSRTVAVCQVKFVPIGGYRPDNPGIKYMTETDEVEVWLVPVPETSIYVPYRIVVPTPLGPGSATLAEVETNER
jgi:hypothetical protein